MSNVIKVGSSKGAYYEGNGYYQTKLSHQSQRSPDRGRFIFHPRDPTCCLSSLYQVDYSIMVQINATFATSRFQHCDTLDAPNNLIQARMVMRIGAVKAVDDHSIVVLAFRVDVLSLVERHADVGDALAAEEDQIALLHLFSFDAM